MLPFDFELRFVVPAFVAVGLLFGLVGAVHAVHHQRTKVWYKSSPFVFGVLFWWAFTLVMFAVLLCGRLSRT
jgi:hypothetical protein